MKNIRKPEKEVLVEQKIKEGKTYKQANTEVQRDINYIKGLERDNRDKKLRLKKLEEENKRINERFKREFEKLKNKKEKEREKKIKDLKVPMRRNSSYASTPILNRITFYLGDIKTPVNKSQICRDCCMSSNYINDAIKFLLKYNLIKEVNQKNMKFYTI